MPTTVIPTVSIGSLDADLASSTFTLTSSPWSTIADNYTIGVGSSGIIPGTITGTGTGLYSNNPSGKLSLHGKNADIEINGESLIAMLKRIEERINLLTVNHKLESEWEELRELGNQYRELEQRIKDKLETWDKLKAQDKDNR